MEEVNLNHIVVIGGSAGSLEVLLQLMSAMAPDFHHPIVLVLHRRATDDNLLENLFAAKCAFPVVSVEDKTPLRPGCLFIAPSDYHLLFERDATLSLDMSAKINFSRPSIDVSFESVADAWGAKVTAILLSGANSDGTRGLKAIQEKGGLAVVQDPATAAMPTMPQSAIEALSPDGVATPLQLIEIIKKGTI